MSKISFKPLWMIHNRIYRQYAKGIGKARCKRYLGKIINHIGRMKHISSRGRKKGG